MAKNNDISNALGDLMGSAPAPKVKEKITSVPSGAERKSGKNRNFTFRMSDSDRAILEKHFEDKGIINLSIGIRQLISDYMKAEGLK